MTLHRHPSLDACGLWLWLVTAVVFLGSACHRDKGKEESHEAPAPSTDNKSSGSTKMKTKIDAKAVLARCEATGKLDGVLIEYYVGGGLPPPMTRADQFLLVSREGRDVMEYSRPNFDPKYDKLHLDGYPNDTYSLPASPADVKKIARLMRETGVFEQHFPEEARPGIADILRTEINVVDSHGEDGRTYYQRAPVALDPLRVVVEALIAHLKVHGDHGVYDKNNTKLDEPKR
jgi:hypothetical protein